MAEYVTRIRTQEGDKQIDYTALANLPQADTTLTQSGQFADAKAVGEKIKSMSSDIAKNIKPEDIGALPDTYTPPVTSVNGQTGDVSITVASAPVTSVDGKTGDVQTGAYTANNPPPYPVTSVNGKTGAVTLSASDVKAAASDHTHNYLSSANFSFNSSTGRLTITI